MHRDFSHVNIILHLRDLFQVRKIERGFLMPILVNNQELEIREYQGQRVVTFNDIDSVHRRPSGTAGRNFRENRKHFIKNEDFFEVTPVSFQLDEIRRFGINSPKGGILITESGYLMLVKSFTDDLAWEVQRQLVKTYFRVKEMSSQPQTGVRPLYYKSQPVLRIVDIEEITEINKSTIYYILQNDERFRIGVEYYYLIGPDLNEFKQQNGVSKQAKVLIVVSRSGVVKLVPSIPEGKKMALLGIFEDPSESKSCTPEIMSMINDRVKVGELRADLRKKAYSLLENYTAQELAYMKKSILEQLRDMTINDNLIEYVNIYFDRLIKISKIA